MLLEVLHIVLQIFNWLAESKQHIKIYKFYCLGFIVVVL